MGSPFLESRQLWCLSCCPEWSLILNGFSRRVVLLLGGDRCWLVGEPSCPVNHCWILFSCIKNCCTSCFPSSACKPLSFVHLFSLKSVFYAVLLHRITKVGNDLRCHPVQPSSYHQHFPTQPHPSVQHLNVSLTPLGTVTQPLPWAAHSSV